MLQLAIVAFLLLRLEGGVSAIDGALGVFAGERIRDFPTYWTEFSDSRKINQLGLLVAHSETPSLPSTLQPRYVAACKPANPSSRASNYVGLAKE